MTGHNLITKGRNGNLTVDLESTTETGPNTHVMLVHTTDGNHHSTCEVVLAGRLDPKAIVTLLEVSLHSTDGPDVLPDQIGLPHPLTMNGFSFNPDVDAPDATIVEIAYTNTAPSIETTASDLEASIRVVRDRGWDESVTVGLLTGEIDPPFAAPTPTR